MLSIAKRNLKIKLLALDLARNTLLDLKLAEKFEIITGGSGLTKEEVKDIILEMLPTIPSNSVTGLTQEEKDKLSKAYIKPINGIPASDLANGVIPSLDGLETSNHAQLTYLPKGNYALKTEIPEAYDDSALKALIEAKQDKGNYLTEALIEAKNYLTNSDIVDLYKKPEDGISFSDLSSNISKNIADVELTDPEEGESYVAPENENAFAKVGDLAAIIANMNSTIAALSTRITVLEQNNKDLSDVLDELLNITEEVTE